MSLIYVLWARAMSQGALFQQKTSACGSPAFWAAFPVGNCAGNGSYEIATGQPAFIVQGANHSAFVLAFPGFGFLLWKCILGRKEVKGRPYLFPQISWSILQVKGKTTGRARPKRKKVIIYWACTQAGRSGVTSPLHPGHHPRVENGILYSSD